MNTNTMELNLNEMEMINGGNDMARWKRKDDRITNGMFIGAGVGGVLGGIAGGPGGVFVGGFLGGIFGVCYGAIYDSYAG